MTFLLDTNVVSEIRKGDDCQTRVAAWFDGVGDADLFISVLTAGEIRKGIESVRPRDPRRAARLERWLAELERFYAERILPVDAQVADAWGRICAHRSAPTVDSLLAATAMVHGMTLVTRNTSDVDGLGASVLNPFE